MNNLSPKLEAVRLTGAERFTSQQKELEFSPLDFWCWAVSDIASNATRGVELMGDDYFPALEMLIYLKTI